MKLFAKLDLQKMRAFASTHRKPLALGLLLVFVGLIFLISRNEDSKVIMYKDVERPDYSESKIVSPSSDIYQKRERTLSSKIEELEKEVKAINDLIEKQSKVVDQARTSNPTLMTEPQPAQLSPSPAISVEPQAAPAPHVRPAPSPAPVAPAPAAPPAVEKGPDVISFPIKAKVERTEESVKLPSGSFVKAKLLTGVEAPEGKALPVLLQADYAFVGPNKSRIDLSGCFLIAKSTGNLSIERVEMQASKISCVSKNGRMFERDLNGFIADNKDNSFAVIGDVNSKQDRVASMAFLASVVAGISNAISSSQTTTETNGLGGSSMTITGDQQKYIAANGAGNAASVVTQWYLKHAQSLLPTINVGSGQDIWIIVQDSVELPNWYFKKQDSGSREFNFLSRLTD